MATCHSKQNMFLMVDIRRNIAHFAIALMLLLFFEFRPSFAAEILFSPRDNMIFTTLNFLQEKQEAIGDSMKDAQMKLIENTPQAGEIKAKIKARGKPRKRGFGFKGFGLKVHPYLITKVQFDDNIDSTPEKRKSEFSYSVTPGVRMNFFGRGKSLSLDTYVGDQYYQHRHLENSQDINTAILANFGIGRNTLSISNYVSTNRITTKELGMRTDPVTYYWKNAFNAIFGRHFNRIGFDLGYGNTYYNYEDIADYLDHFEEEYRFNQYLRIATKTRLLFKYIYGRAKYNNKLVPSLPEYHSHAYDLGITGVLSPKITALIGANYKMTENKIGYDTAESSFTGKIGYRISDRTDLSIILTDLIHEEKAKTNYFLEYKFSFNGNHRLAFNPKLGFSLFQSTDLFYYPKRINLGERNYIYTFGTGLNYAFSNWIDFGLTFSHKESYSNVSDDYNDNVAMFTTQARF